MDNDSIAYIDLFGVVLSGAKRPEDGLYWTNLEGWWGLPDLKTDSDSIPGANGRFTRAHHYRDSRAITLVGHILTKSSSDLVSVRHRLEAALSAGYGQMRVTTDSYGSWSRMVEVDTLDIEPDHGKEWTKFTVDMIAPDPLRYQDMISLGPVGLPTRQGGLILPKEFPWWFGVRTGGTLDIVNSGDVDVYPIIYLSGGFDSVKVDVGGRRMEFGAVPSGQTLELDSRDRRAYLNGRDVTRLLSRREWPVVPPGTTQTVRFYCVNPSDPTVAAKYQNGAW